MKAPVSTDMQVYLERVEDEGKRSFGVSCAACRDTGQPCNPCKLSLVFWLLRHPGPATLGWVDEPDNTIEQNARSIGGG